MRLPAPLLIAALSAGPLKAQQLNIYHIDVDQGTVDLTGWWLEDAAGRRWPLTDLGTIAAGASETTVRNGLPLNLNNNGDTVKLIDPLGQTRDEFTYPTSSEGVRITTGHQGSRQEASCTQLRFDSSRPA